MSAQPTALGADLQAKIFQRLNSYGPLRELLGEDGGVFDFVPDKQTFPYVVINDEAVDPWNTKTFKGFQGNITIEVWTRNQGREGRLEVKQIMKSVWQGLEDYALALPDRKQIAFVCGGQRVEPQPDNITYKGLLIFNFIFGGNDHE